MDELADAVKKTLIQRINTPLFGFVVLSWFGFNWSNVLIVLMGDGKLQDRIALVKGEPDILLNSLVYPFLCGFAVAVILPYLSHFVSFLQRFAQVFADFNDKERARLDYITRKELAKDDAEAASEHAYQMAKFAKRNAELEQETVAINYNIEEIRKEYKDIKDQCDAEVQRLEALQEHLNKIEEDITVKDKNLKEITMSLGPYEDFNLKLNEIEKSRNFQLRDIADDVKRLFAVTEIYGVGEHFFYDEEELNKSGVTTPFDRRMVIKSMSEVSSVGRAIKESIGIIG